MTVALRVAGDLQSVEVDVMMSIVIEWLWCLVDKNDMKDCASAYQQCLVAASYCCH